MRAHERYLGFPPSQEALSEEALVPLDNLFLEEPVQRFLQRQLAVPGRWRGGLLFGQARLGTLRVVHASPPAYPSLDSGSRESPLHLDPRYVLGWSDCIQAVHGNQMDWVGNWLAAPDSQLRELEEQLNWVRRGGRRGLFDDRHPLVVIGLNEGMFQNRGYTFDAGNWFYLPQMSE